jgi:uncharacterized membrane protein YraQ (UPF0718 family)
MNCFIWIYFPIVLAAIIAVVASYIASFFIGVSVKTQLERVSNEVRDPWIRAKENIVKQKQEVRRKSRIEQAEMARLIREEAEERERQYQEALAEEER